MPDEATSLHLRNAHELLLLVPLRHGFVEGGERQTSYATRLRTLLTMLFRPSQSVHEKTLMPTASFSDKIQNIYHFNYGVVDRLQRSELILSATFDSSWETYFRNLVREMGPFLDVVFSHGQGYRGRSCADGYEAFAGFIREHQVQTGILYSATPDLTVDDLRLLRSAARGGPSDEPILPVQEVVDRDKPKWESHYEAAIGEKEFERLRALGITQLVRSVWEVRKLFPETEMIDARSAQEVFDDAAALLASSFIFDKKFEEVIANAVAPDAKYGDPRKWIVEIVRLAARQGRAPGQSDTAEPKASLPRELAEVAAKSDPERDPSAIKDRIQENILDSCRSRRGVLALLRFPATRVSSFLGAIAECCASSRALHINVAFTHAGLRRVGLDDATLEWFPKEFREGMAQRAASLGDVGWPNHPDYWHIIGRSGRFSLESIDLVLVFHGDETAEGKLARDAEALLKSWCAESYHSSVVHTEELWHSDGEDNFGYRAQPESQPSFTTAAGKRVDGKPVYGNETPLGELLLGYPDGSGDTARATEEEHNPGSAELFMDGTFLVIRKLEQNRRAFDKYVSDNHSASNDVRKSILGVLDPPLESSEDFSSPHASTCPLHAHVRRANPRLPGGPRIVRRSFSYGSPYDPSDATTLDQERGHLFMAYNASIAQQFEVIQRWINGGNSTGLLSTKSDLFAGGQPPRGVRFRTESGELTPPATPHVILRWGLYLFVPSRRALSYLAEVGTDQDSRAEAAGKSRRTRRREAERTRLELRGRKLLLELDAIRDAELARRSWKQLLEEPGNAVDAEAVWAAIRAQGGRKQTPYGLLVGDLEGAQRVLGDKGATFSVREYRQRLSTTAGDFYLGMDEAPDPCHQPIPSPTYGQLANQANQTLRSSFLVDDAYRDARECAWEFLKKKERDRVGKQEDGFFDLRELARHVVGAIAARWIGIPEPFASNPRERSVFLEHFINVTRYSSFPYPEVWTARDAFASGKKLLEAYGDSADTLPGIGPLLGRKYGSKRVIRDAVVGANIGFVPPSISMLAGILGRWIENGDLETLAQDVSIFPVRVYASESQAGKSRRMLLTRAVLEELKRDPTFTTVYRTAIEGNELATPGTFVVVGMQSASADAEARESGDSKLPAAATWLFGGAYKSESTGGTQHGCPMREPAVAVIAGAISGVADFIRDQLSRDASKALVRVGPFTYTLCEVEKPEPNGPKRGAPPARRKRTQERAAEPTVLETVRSIIVTIPRLLRIRLTAGARSLPRVEG